MIDAHQLAAGGQHERQRVLGDGEGVDAGRVADRHAAPAGRVEVEVVGARAPDRHHLELRARGEDTVGEARVRADVDGDARTTDAPDQLGFLVRAARRVDDRLAELARGLVGRGLVEDAREIVRHDDEGIGH